MHRLTGIAELGELDGPIVLCIGVFDGVHLGHQRVVSAAIRDAAELGGCAVVLTFDPHPARVLRPDRAPRLLTSTEHKARLLAACGVENLLIQRFDADFAAQAPEDFLRALAASARTLRQITVGEHWTFGRARSGDVALLRRVGDALDYRVSEVAPVELDGETISSTRIRRAVEAGDLELARRCLGRDFTVLGTVEQGRQLGRQLGFPTANLRAHNEQFPPDGVWAVRCAFDGAELPGVANIGFRPTVADGPPQRTLEVHVLDFNDDLYGQDLEVTFVAYLRAEQKFADVEALKAQIARDAGAARAALEMPSCSGASVTVGSHLAGRCHPPGIHRRS